MTVTFRSLRAHWMLKLSKVWTITSQNKNENLNGTVRHQNSVKKTLTINFTISLKSMTMVSKSHQLIYKQYLSTYYETICL